MPTNPNPPYLRVDLRNTQNPSALWRRTDYAFRFDNLPQFNAFIDEKTATATDTPGNELRRMASPGFIQSDINSEGPRWYGTANAADVTANLQSYFYQNNLDNLMGLMSANTASINVSDLDQNKAIRFTEQEIGIFSFDLASLGLIKVFEYYSPLLREKVNANLVVSEKNANGAVIFYHVFQAYVPRHIVKYAPFVGGYYSSVLKRVVDIEDLVWNPNIADYEYPERPEIPRHEIMQIHAEDAEGNKKYASTFKKSFIYIPKVEKPRPKVDIIIPFSFSANDDADTMQYNCLPGLAAAEMMDRLKIDFNLIAAYPTTNSGNRVFQFIVLKDTQMGYDRNQVATFLSDPRYYRYQRFRSVLSAYDDVGIDMGITWSTIRNENDIKNAYVDMLSQSTNPKDQASAQVPNAKIVTGVSSDMQQAIQNFDTIVQFIRSL
jgi:hypothetical protein